MLDKGEATDPFIVGLLSKFMAQQRRLRQLTQIEKQRNKVHWKTIVSRRKSRNKDTTLRKHLEARVSGIDNSTISTADGKKRKTCD